MHAYTHTYMHTWTQAVKDACLKALKDIHTHTCIHIYMHTWTQAVKDACLKALKERLIDRAHIIETRLEEEQAALTKRQLGYQRQVCLHHVMLVIMRVCICRHAYIL